MPYDTGLTKSTFEVYRPAIEPTHLARTREAVVQCGSERKASSFGPFEVILRSQPNTNTVTEQFP